MTRGSDVDRNDLAKLDPAEPATLSGPFQWAALKSKYFVTGLLAGDTTGGISGATATALPDPAGKKPTAARIRVSLPVSPAGDFRYTVYAGPMEYDRLARLGHNFDDVNPYGYPGLRTLIRLFAVPVRWLLVWMHEHLLLSYGVVLIVFGLLVRLLLWPLNQKAMRANMKMQEVQPLMKDIQERHKEDPQRMQQEMFKLYKEHGVNPLGGCWPMLLPMPILFALFFVFQNAIELRGTSFLWIPDLSRPDPLYIIPLADGDLDVRPHQGGAGGDGAQSADEDDAVLHAGDDDRHVPVLPLRAQPVLHRQQHRQHSAAVDARAGAAAANRPGHRRREDRPAAGVGGRRAPQAGVVALRSHRGPGHSAGSRGPGAGAAERHRRLRRRGPGRARLPR